MTPGLKQTASQEERGVAYRYYVENAAAEPSIVGAHWFEWVDEPSTGRFDGKNYNIGIVDVTDQAVPRTGGSGADHAPARAGGACRKRSAGDETGESAVADTASACERNLAVGYNPAMFLTRRSFLGPLLASPLAGAYATAAQSAVPSKITRIETVYWKSRNDAPFWPHWTWVKIDTNAGIFGIGETYPRNPAEAAAVHGAATAWLISRDPRDIERIWADLYRAFDFQVAGGAEIRALSAIDLALWDLLGKHLNAPVYRLIGGKANPRVRLYNTCFPYKYDFNREPEKIMRELIDTRGIKAIKVWPFDGAAARNRNQFVTTQDIDEALTPIKKLREAFGSEIEIAVEFHSQWNVTSAIRIAHALEPYQQMSSSKTCSCPATSRNIASWRQRRACP